MAKLSDEQRRALQLLAYRWGNAQPDLLPGLAADLVRRQVTVIVAGGGYPTALAASAATSTIPIVLVVGTDPVIVGLAASLNQPGGNVTGVTFMTNELMSKRLGLLRELVPQAATVGSLAMESRCADAPTVDLRRIVWDLQAAVAGLVLVNWPR
jgi:putative tryptophan/tyrosine transport system substrate-binding protein